MYWKCFSVSSGVLVLSCESYGIPDKKAVRESRKAAVLPAFSRRTELISQLETELTEKHFQYTFYLILRLIGVYCLRIEQTQSRGRVDCILETPQYIYIFEFKLDGSADEALRQIEEKGYAQPYLADKRKIVCIGVVFSSQTRTISEWKEVR